MCSDFKSLTRQVSVEWVEGDRLGDDFHSSCGVSQVRSDQVRGREVRRVEEVRGELRRCSSDALVGGRSASLENSLPTKPTFNSAAQLSLSSAVASPTRSPLSSLPGDVHDNHTHSRSPSSSPSASSPSSRRTWGGGRHGWVYPHWSGITILPPSERGGRLIEWCARLASCREV